MTQKSIPFLFMRGGTSKGPYFKQTDLPLCRDKLSPILISIIGSGNANNIDGLGGGNPVTTKVAILSKSPEEGIDIDFLFAQVSVKDHLVDYGPTCGNILVGVGPASIEFGLVSVSKKHSSVMIRAVNTGAKVKSIVETPNGIVNYSGNKKIDGVPGASAPVELEFFDGVGSKTGHMFPSGKKIDLIHGIPVTLMDVAMPMMIAKAEDFGIKGNESRNNLDNNSELFEKLEMIRKIASQKMGLGDCTNCVIPKIGLVSKARNQGHFTARYFMPWRTHPALAVTGSQCLGACALSPGTILNSMISTEYNSPKNMKIEHPSGIIELTIKYQLNDKEFDFKSACLVRTSRLIAAGNVFVPSELL